MMDFIIDDTRLLKLTEGALANPRLRLNEDFRDSSTDESQRMLNALEPGTVLPIHRHTKSSETCFLLKGKIKVSFFDDNKKETGSFMLDPLKGRFGINIPQGQWHNTESMESGSVIFECKNGAYAPLTAEDILE